MEGIIAIGVIITAVVGSLVLIMTTIKLGRANQDRVVAQNLAREGVELVVSLRNSASLMRASDASVSWDQFFTTLVPKNYAALAHMDVGADFLGFYQITGDTRWCYERGADVTPPACGGYPSDNCVRYDSNVITGVDIVVNPGQTVPAGVVNRCDIIALENYIFAGWDLPRLCGPLQDAFPYPGVSTTVDCDFNGDNQLDISDLVMMVNTINDASYHLTTGFPKMAIKPPGTQTVAAQLEMFVPATIDLTFDPNEAWNDSRARVQSYLGTYMQNVDASNPALAATKYFRVVSTREVCRTPGGEEIMPMNSNNDCKGEFAGAKKVGVLVTSEVRWPTPTSSTKAVYQTYLYDWLQF
ncbi:MAG: hypothetical protein WC786_00205 [Patescibacteria group bacterium]